MIDLALVLAGFGIGIYLQDQKHRESTQAAFTANRFNLERFNKIRDYTIQLDSTNWQQVRMNIGRELDSFIILRFRREVDSLSDLKAQH